MIYAQRPDATACADYDLWNKRMRRYVMRGAKGIALIDTSTGENKVRYVFDVSDTGERENARRPWLWQYRPEHQQAVSAALEERYGISGEDGLASQMETIAGQLASEYWNDNRNDLLHIVDGSFLEEYDDFNIEMAFKRAASVSITYALLSRCGLEPEEYFDYEDFTNFFDFNTRDTLTALGMAVSYSNEQVLRQIEVTSLDVAKWFYDRAVTFRWLQRHIYKGRTQISNTQRHNEREKDSYTNPDIVPERATLNVHFKEPTDSYAEMFARRR